MDSVDLLQCSRCRLLFVKGSEAIPGYCPQCRKDFSVPTEILVAGQNIPVTRVLELGSRISLCDKDVRRGLDTLKLGSRCEHGWITELLCPECVKSLQ